MKTISTDRDLGYERGTDASMHDRSDRPPRSWRRLLVGFGATALLAAVVNAVTFGLASAVGAIPAGVVLPTIVGRSTLTVAAVVATTVLSEVWAAIVFSALWLIVRRPAQTFRVVATIALLLSLALPATAPGPSLPMRLSMAVMHIAAWAVAVTVLPNAASRAD